MSRGKVAASVAAVGVALAASAVALGAVFAATGAFLLIVAPLVGLSISLAVYRALHRLCSTGSRRAEASAVVGIWMLAAIAILGISFGGAPLLLSAMFLALATAVTPRPGRGQRHR